MADFKDERVYDGPTLTRWFLWSSLALLVCVGIMAYKDYHRSWKEYQRKFMTLDRIHAKLQAREFRANFDVAQYKQLKADLKEANLELKSHQNQISQLESKRDKLDAQIFKVKSNYQMVKANVDADKYSYSEGVKNGNDDKAFKKKLDGEIDEAASLNQRLFEMNQDQDKAVKDLTDIYAKRDEVQGKIKKMTADYETLKKKIGSLSFDFLFYFRNAMLLDFMSPTLEIQQVVLKNLPEDIYFTKTMRVDRCMSCHLGIDKKGYDEEHYPGIPKVFRSHPHLDLFLSATSPHPMEKIGCTICHGGMGQALSFNTAAHVPNDEEEAKQWKRKYGWEEPEAVQSIMLPLKYTEGSCLKCHGIQQHVNFAPKLNRGRELMATRGCVGCHKVKNMDQLTKAGPALLRVRGKLKKDFVLKWVWSPKSFNPAARMPSFFQQSNNDSSNPEAFAKTKAELHALVDYIYDDRSGDYSPNLAPGRGSVAAGKKLFHDVGCLACHGIDDVTSIHSDFAPDLSGTGSKLSAAFVYSWIKNPQHFNPDTRMPSLRLSDQEASDITAYLMSKRNKDFEEAQAPDFDPAVRDQLILDHLTPKLGVEGAKATLATMDEKGRQMFLGERTLNRYGCFGCHMIRGFEDAQRIGTELSTWGSKRVTQLDFGFTDPKDISHTHEGFVNAKLQNPRQFDKDKVVSFFDRLKMPNFYLNDADREAIVTAVLGLTNTYVPDEMTAGIHGNGPLLEKGKRVIEDFNCRGCHLIEAKDKSIDAMLSQGQGGRILQMFKNESVDYSMGPPNLNTEGAKLQVDWFHDFLMGPHPIRPWLHIRMPSFHWTDEKISAVISYFNYKDDQVFPFKSAETTHLTGEDLAQAKALFNDSKCSKCHIIGNKVPPDLSSAAPDLLNVHKRLKPDWVVEWLKDPNAIMPDTRMTNFWPDGVPSFPKYFHGDSLEQREALRDYLFMMGRDTTPSEEGSVGGTKAKKN
ncbi:MAG TPA: c-type cytochrome [bacterium]|nr:c-type cytochrome [bacterium]